MRTLSVLIVVTSLVTGCTQGSFDAASGYPSFPAAASPGASPTNGSNAVGRERVASTDNHSLDALRADAPKLEPRFVPHEIAAPREPAPRRDLVECWQCRR